MGRRPADSGGQPDDAFGGGDGYVETQLGEASGFARAVAVTGGGQILVAGDASAGGLSHGYLARYDADGTLDATFGDAGVADLGVMVPRGIALRPDGGVVVAGSGSQYTSGGTAYGVVRLTAVSSSGTTDAGFGNGGSASYVLGSPASDSTAYALLRRSDGSLVIAGSAWSDGDNALDFLLARFSPTGELLGKTLTEIGDRGEAEAYALAQDGDGRLVAAGYTNDAGGYRWAAARYLADGTADAAFGTGGTVVTTVGGDSSKAYGVATGDDGSVLLGGFAEQSSGNSFALARYMPSGVLDTSFSEDGVILEPMTRSRPSVRSMVLTPDNRAVLTGWSGDQIAAARFVDAFGSSAPPVVPVASVDDATVTEGSSGTTTASVTVHLDSAPTSSVSVDWATSDGTATAPGDYTASSGTLSFDAGQTTATVSVPVVPDAADEPDETFGITLSSPHGVTIGDGQATVTITDDDTAPDPGPAPPVASVDDASVTEGSSGTTTATLTVHLDSAPRARSASTGPRPTGRPPPPRTTPPRTARCASTPARPSQPSRSRSHPTPPMSSTRPSGSPSPHRATPRSATARPPSRSRTTTASRP